MLLTIYMVANCIAIAFAAFYLRIILAGNCQSEMKNGGAR
jgi:hypothetical protein